MNIFRKLVGRWRLAYGFCPACNSDAPKLDACPVCKGLTARDLGGFPPAQPVLDTWWLRFTRPNVPIKNFKL